MDNVILEGVGAGWFKENDLMPLLTKIDTDARIAGLRQAIHAPWDLVHGSFDDNIEDVVKALSHLTMDHAKHMSPIQITERASALTEFGYEELADKVVEEYIEAISNLAVKSVLSLSSLDVGPFPVHSKIKEFIAQKVTTEIEPVDPKEILLRMSRNRSWSHDDTEFLSKISVENFEEIVMILRGEDINAAVYMALGLGSIQGGMEEYKSFQAICDRHWRESLRPTNLTSFVSGNFWVNEMQCSDRTA